MLGKNWREQVVQFHLISGVTKSSMNGLKPEKRPLVLKQRISVRDSDFVKYKNNSKTKRASENWQMKDNMIF